MKKVLFASTATAALAIGGMASAQGIALFGDARLGLGWNINNEGGATGDDELRAVSRVRFGVNMTGETDSGITFGATIRADNARGGQGGANGQTDGNVFVSGSYGTLTFGDTSGADENWVGDIPGNLSLTGLGDLHETPFISNGGNFGSDSSNDFAANPTARPTIRYDFDIAGFGISLSSNRDINDVVVGAGYAADFGGGSWGLGVGYNDYNDFIVVGEAGTATVCFSEDANGISTVTVDSCDDNGLVGEDFLVPEAAVDENVPGGTQWSAGLTGDYEAFSFGVVYTNADSDGNTELETIGVGGTFGFDAFTVGAYYVNILNANGGVAEFDGNSTYGLTAEYDLGGGAVVAGGVARTFGEDELFEDGNLINTDEDAETVADFGIRMSF
jgi:outer membrane protein OmpU